VSARPAGRRLHLNANLLHIGHFGGAWRAPGADPRAFLDVEHFVGAARIAEDAGFDAVFLADRPEVLDDVRTRPMNALDASVLLGAIAARTTRIGLIGTASTTYNEPYNVARRFATLDHISGGRAGWNVVTTAGDVAARNFGRDVALDHASRYLRAAEFVEVVRRLWDSWDDDALVADVEAGVLVDLERVEAIDHRGEHFQVAGPLTLPRSAQGQPVLVQAGASADGTAFAARHAEVVFSAAQTLEGSLAHAGRLRALAAAAGRDSDRIVLLPGLVPVVGSTEAEARARLEALADLAPAGYATGRLAHALGVAPELLELDAELPWSELPPPDAVPSSETFFRIVTDLARAERLTVRQLVARFGGGVGHRVVVGTPEQIADAMETWFQAGAADGFNLIADAIPSGLQAFADHVIPELRRRGLVRVDAGPSTLRERYGLPVPARRDRMRGVA
jgi:FMN-dependent oxidoreductase (nitrilotriacetate monooxygenase family)